MYPVFDVAIIGGGINGCGIAADASMRGLSVLLLEKGDIASGTSSRSTKLIHGGLRYLAYGHFGLVKKALHERAVLLNIAPHLVSPLPIILPTTPHARSPFTLRLGLFLYDHLSQANTLPHAHFIRRAQASAYFDPLNKAIKNGFLFHDATTNDARLTLANALQAKRYGATICSYTALQSATTHNGLWQLSTNTAQMYQAKVLINATGPWVDSINQQLNLNAQHKLSLIQGSHFVVKPFYTGSHAYLLQHQDGRVVFVMPYQGYTMIGTTDTPFSGQLDSVMPTLAERDYLFELIKHYFKTELTPDDIVHAFSGVRPLIAHPGDKPQNMLRDYQFEIVNTPAPAVIIYGGKVTTYRQLAKEVVDKLRSFFPTLPDTLTATTPLPGGLLGYDAFHAYKQHVFDTYSAVDNTLLSRWISLYGTNTDRLLVDGITPQTLGHCFGGNLFEKEVDYLVREEGAVTADDILWRRTTLGLSFDKQAIGQLATYLGHG